MIMTPEQVKARVGKIAAAADDPEKAHALEDELYRDVMRAIANGHLRIVHLMGVAQEALKSAEALERRWSA
jgi:hypothetical protein